MTKIGLVQPDIRKQKTVFMGRILVNDGFDPKSLDPKKDAKLFKSITEKGVLTVNDYVKIVPESVVKQLIKKKILKEVTNGKTTK